MYDTDTLSAISDSGHEPTFTIPCYAPRAVPEMSYEALLDVARGEYLDFEDTAA